MMRARSTKTDSQGGFALVASLIFVMVVATMGAAFTQVSSSAAREQSHAVKQLQAFYIAEAGLAEAFLAVRMGRTGTIASPDLPATYGNGRLWVESVETADRRIYLRSTAVSGRSRASLGLIILPDAPPLGFFADTDLVIESVLLVDGFDSTERSYVSEVLSLTPIIELERFEGKVTALQGPEALLASRNKAGLLGLEGLEELLALEELLGLQGLLGVEEHTSAVQAITELMTELNGKALGQAVAPVYAAIMTRENLEYILVNQFTTEASGSAGLSHEPINPHDYMSEEECSQFIENAPEMLTAYQAGTLFETSRPSETPTEVLAPMLTDGWSSLDPDDPGRLALHTSKGGMLGSNGNIHFEGDLADLVEVHGSVIPGVNGTVTGLPDGAVTGSDAPRAMEAELAPVTVPQIVSQGDRSVVTGIPVIVSGGNVAYDTLTVEPLNDLVLRGPLTLVVEHLNLNSGSSLVLDTADGDVEIFVTGTMSLDPSAFVQTTGLSSSEVSISATGDGTAASFLDLGATSQFHGTVNAPSSDVTIGSNFEVFGSVVAKRLKISAGARLHFDDETYDGTMPIPNQESWRIMDLPEQADPLSATASASSLTQSRPLALAHDLGRVEIDVKYTDLAGVTRQYRGLEESFDWTNVASSEEVTRKKVAGTEIEDDSKWWESWDQDAFIQFLTEVARGFQEAREG